MNNNVETSFETKRAEYDYIAKIYQDMNDENKQHYSKSYEFENGDKARIQVTVAKYKENHKSNIF